jgi:hypothetical protein
MDIARQIFARPDRQAQLGALDRPDAFLNALFGMVGAQGDHDLIEKSYHSGGVRLRLDKWLPEGWLPIGRTSGCDEEAMDWAWFGAEKIDAPFFDDAVQAARHRPINRFLRISTSFDDFMADADDNEPVPLSGLIFHMSRCGSTLLTNMLAAVAGHRVYSEPQPLDLAITYASKPDVPREKAVALIRAVVAALGRTRGDGAKRLFIKCDAWHVRALPLLRDAFPDVPWLYLFREPLEVVASHSAQPGRHVVPGFVQPPLVDIEDLAPEAYAARALQTIGEAAVRNWSLGGGLAMDYEILVNDGFPSISQHFGLDLSCDDLRAISIASRANAKYPDRPFTMYSAATGPNVSDAMRTLCEAQLQPLHRQLLALAAKS